MSICTAGTIAKPGRSSSPRARTGRPPARSKRAASRRRVIRAAESPRPDRSRRRSFWRAGIRLQTRARHHLAPRPGRPGRKASVRGRRLRGPERVVPVAIQWPERAAQGTLRAEQPLPSRRPRQDARRGPGVPSGRTRSNRPDVRTVQPRSVDCVTPSSEGAAMPPVPGLVAVPHRRGWVRDVGQCWLSELEYNRPGTVNP
jgi:hypothetical protein